MLSFVKVLQTIWKDGTTNPICKVSIEVSTKSSLLKVYTKLVIFFLVNISPVTNKTTAPSLPVKV
ncbi:hypothetical protein EAE69_14890 [Hafnia alvei ATCC 13337]|nr:hypothetical protein EAE69_14890 [Hafnia alvei ATCC 13337]